MKRIAETIRIEDTQPLLSILDFYKFGLSFLRLLLQVLDIHIHHEFILWLGEVVLTTGIF